MQTMWQVYKLVQPALGWLLQHRAVTRQATLDLLVHISSAPNSKTSQQKLFAYSFLEGDGEGHVSNMHYILLSGSGDSQDGAMTKSQPRAYSMLELQSIGLLVGNLALDGISARELLITALTESDFF